MRPLFSLRSDNFEKRVALPDLPFSTVPADDFWAHTGIGSVEGFQNRWLFNAQFQTQLALTPNPRANAKEQQWRTQQRHLARGETFHKGILTRLYTSRSSIPMQRTHFCGALRPEHIGQSVTLCGWAGTVRDQSHQMFIDLRDRTGIVQIVADSDLNPSVHASLVGVKSEYCLQITGEVVARVPGKENPKLASGEVEIRVDKAEILNTSKPLPFELNTTQAAASEEVRLQYRYLDMRRQPVRDILEMRYKLARETRRFLDSEGFWEVETPLLWKSTPEGAREYVVPVRTHPGKGFVLPQSPQICKQLLMVGGVEKYFQIAKCFRDESSRADRQPEFTQIDIEMSFVGQDDVLDLTERLFGHLMREVKASKSSCLFLGSPTPSPCGALEATSPTRASGWS